MVIMSACRFTRQGDAGYRLKTPYRDETTHVVFAPLDFMARLATHLFDWSASVSSRETTLSSQIPRTITLASHFRGFYNVQIPLERRTQSLVGRRYVGYGPEKRPTQRSLEGRERRLRRPTDVPSGWQK